VLRQHLALVCLDGPWTAGLATARPPGREPRGDLGAMGLAPALKAGHSRREAAGLAFGRTRAGRTAAVPVAPGVDEHAASTTATIVNPMTLTAVRRGRRPVLLPSCICPSPVTVRARPVPPSAYQDASTTKHDCRHLSHLLPTVRSPVQGEGNSNVLMKRLYRIA